MKERSIIFNSEMVNAILDGRKSQTRRLDGLRKLNKKPHRGFEYIYGIGGWFVVYCDLDWEVLKSPYGKPGDRLWVRETWRAEELESGLDGIRYKADESFTPIQNTFEASEKWIDAKYSKSGKRYPDHHWRQSIHMPRWASRITLEITEVRLERLQEITLNDINAECTPYTLDREKRPVGSRREQFKRYWDSLIAKHCFPWDSNPYVWVISFERT